MEQIPDGIIRAYRKAIKAREKLPINDNYTFTASQYIEGVLWELERLYPDLKVLPQELTEVK